MIWSGFVIGLLGSVHCIGMCGPLALALPIDQNHKWLSAITYISGKALTYAAIGAFFGLFGYGFQLSGMQSALSIIVGVVVILVVIFPRLFGKIRLPGNFSTYVRKGIQSRLSKKSVTSIFVLGLLNGLLPCGLIYLAIAGALETGFVELAAVYMLLFGMGTSVVLIAAIFSREFFMSYSTWSPKRIVPYFTLLLGLLFITRGILYALPPQHQELAIVDILQTITFCHVD